MSKPIIMIRTVVKSNNNKLILPIPDKYIGRELEIIAFTKDEGMEDTIGIKKDVSFTVLHTEIGNYKFDRDAANER